jgi:hypothetical protein
MNKFDFLFWCDPGSHVSADNLQQGGHDFKNMDLDVLLHTVRWFDNWFANRIDYFFNINLLLWLSPFHVEGWQEPLFDQDIYKVTMGNHERWPFHDMFQWPQNLFSSNSKKFVALPSCSNQDVSDPNLFSNIIQSIRLLHISSELFYVTI